MALIIWLQALEPRVLLRVVFASISWCGDGPLYFVLFPLLYWRKAPAIAIRYGYLVGVAVLVLTVLKAQTATLRPFLAAPGQVAFLPYSLAGFSWFPNRDALIDAYRHSASFPSGHALCATAVGLYLYAHTASGWGRTVWVAFVVLVPLARLYLGVHYPLDVLGGGGLGVLLFLLATRLRVDTLATRLAPWGVSGWYGRLLLVGLLSLMLGMLAKAAVVVFVMFLSYPMILRGMATRIAAFAQPHNDAWRLYNAVLGCLGVGGMVWAAAPLRNSGLLVSVPLITIWVTLGCPLLVETLCPTGGGSGGEAPPSTEC